MQAAGQWPVRGLDLYCLAVLSSHPTGSKQVDSLGAGLSVQVAHVPKQSSSGGVAGAAFHGHSAGQRRAGHLQWERGTNDLIQLAELCTPGNCRRDGSWQKHDWQLLVDWRVSLVFHRLIARPLPAWNARRLDHAKSTIGKCGTKSFKFPRCKIDVCGSRQKFHDVSCVAALRRAEVLRFCWRIPARRFGAKASTAVCDMLCHFTCFRLKRW